MLNQKSLTYKINQLFQIVGAGIVAVLLLILCAIIFFYFTDPVIHVENDTSETVEIVMLLQNHDDSGFYLSRTLRVESGMQIKESIGFESVRCLYVNTQGNEYSSVFAADQYEVKDGAPKRTYIDVSSLVSSASACPLDQAEFQEGVRNRTQLSRDKLPK